MLFTQGTVEFRPSRMIAILGGATAVVVCAWIAVLIWALNVSSASLDATQNNGERRLLRSVFDTYQKTLSKNVTDYAWWDELYNYFQGPPSAAWEEDNLGPYISEHFDIDYVAVTSKSGAMLYLYSHDQKHAVLSAKDAAVLAKLTHVAFQSSKGRNEAASSGIVEFGGKAGIAAVSAIHVPPENKNLNPERAQLCLVEIRALTPAFLSKIGHGYGVANLAVSRSGAASLALHDPTSAPSIFRLSWEPSKSGHDLFLRILPTILLIGFASLLSFLALMALGSRVIRHLRSGETRILNAELDASRARAQAAEETSRSKSTFIANMSHELRTPLNAIIGFSDFICSEALGPVGNRKYREYIGDISSSGQHLLRIVNDILQVSKIEAGKFEPVIEDASLSEILIDSVRMMEVLAAKRRIALHVSQPESSIPIRTDRQALHQILLNIISNAVKFSCDGGSVEIECMPSGEHGAFVIAVVDHGCGIPENVLHELGKPFVQAEGAYRRTYQGTGLGLAISFLLAQAIGASIEISSVEHSGTTVRVLIGQADGAQAQAAPDMVQAA